MEHINIICPHLGSNQSVVILMTIKKLVYSFWLAIPNRQNSKIISNVEERMKIIYIWSWSKEKRYRLKLLGETEDLCMSNKFARIDPERSPTSSSHLHRSVLYLMRIWIIHCTGILFEFNMIHRTWGSLKPITRDEIDRLSFTLRLASRC